MCGHFPYSDREIILGFQQRDENLLRQFYQEYLKKVEMMVRNYGGTPEDAEDVFQDALIAAYVNIRNGHYTYREEAHFSTYFIQICKFRFLEKMRTAENRFTRSEDMLEHIIKGDDDIQLNLETIEMSYRVHQLVEQLDDHCKEILEAYYWERLSMKEIGERLDMTPESVRNAKYRCINKLKKLLRKLRPSLKI